MWVDLCWTVPAGSAALISTAVAASVVMQGHLFQRASFAGGAGWILLYIRQAGFCSGVD